MNIGDEFDELKIASVVDLTRKSQEHNKGLSFATIAGYGPNSALPHYQPSNATSKKVQKESTFVLDSGGQYDGNIQNNYSNKHPNVQNVGLFRWHNRCD